MSGLYARSSHLLLKVPSILWTIVSLHHGNGESPLLPCFQHSPGSVPRAELWYQDGMCHPGEQVNDGVVLQSSARLWIDMVNGVRLDEFTRTSSVRTPGVIRAN